MPNRQDPRSPFSIMVFIDRPSQEGETGFYGLTHDLSESGLLLTSGRRLELGEPIRVRLFLPRTRKQLELEAEVVRPVFENTASGYGPGEEQMPDSYCYGVRFRELSPMEVALIRSFVDRFASGAS